VRELLASNLRTDLAAVLKDGFALAREEMDWEFAGALSGATLPSLNKHEQATLEYLCQVAPACQVQEDIATRLRSSRLTVRDALELLASKHLAWEPKRRKGWTLTEQGMEAANSLRTAK
jgi:hypothetical protein